MFMYTVQLSFMFSTDEQLVLIWILQMHFWGMLITKSLFFMNTKFMSVMLTYLLLLLCSIMDTSLSQTTHSVISRMINFFVVCCFVNPSSDPGSDTSSDPGFILSLSHF